MNTNQMDKTTPEERNALRGYCENCKVWTPFVRYQDPEVCGSCGGGFAQKHGLQVTTQRTPLTGKYKAIRNERTAA